MNINCLVFYLKHKTVYHSIVWYLQERKDKHSAVRNVAHVLYVTAIRWCFR